MVDDVEIKRFPWTYSRLEHKDQSGNVTVMYRVRLDLLIVENRSSLTLFDIDYFSNLYDRIDNAQAAQDSGRSFQFGKCDIIVSESSFPWIYEEILNHENLCV